MKMLLTGNEAIARGAYEYGVKVAVAYPGTPSTEILENIAKYPDIHAQWSPNEKVALEVGIGASIGGGRVLVAMKHVGVNVAADPLMTLAYTGVGGGLVLVSADDPGMHSSQNEQDNRRYARFAKVPLLEPADSQEAKKMVGLALEISERFDTPVILRTTTRVAHSQGLVALEEPGEYALRPYQKDIAKYVMVPANARRRRLAVEERLGRLREYAETCPANGIQWGDKSIGVITSGIAYQYVKEALPGVSVLKLGLTYPLPKELIREFASQVERLYVIEELEPFLEEQIKAMGLKVTGKEIFSSMGELSPRLIAAGVLGDSGPQTQAPAPAPVRPPVMCPGCPHRGVFYTLRQLKLVVSGDIGCYTLGALSPLEAMDTCVCMGSSIGGALGMEKANPELKGKTVAVIGDSTFLHSGIAPLLDVVYNGGSTTTLILDNRTTAMTGHQEHPATGYTLKGDPAPQVDFETLVRALGVKRVFTVDPFALNELKALLKEELAAEEPSVIIVRRPCALLEKTKMPPMEIQGQVCSGCQACMRTGCPALKAKGGQVVIDAALCTGCGLCAKVCKFKAIKGLKAGERLG